MQSDESHGFDWEVPIVRDRHELFDQESALADPVESLPGIPEGQDPAEDLRRMREEAARRTAGGDQTS